MPFTDSRMGDHAASLNSKPAFGFGRGEKKEDLPSAEDLDKVADEDKARAATKPKRKIIAQG